MAAMSEMTYLNDLIMEVARVLWRRQKGVKRARDYPSEPILRVERFAKGSAIPLIDRDGASSVLTGDPYDQSRDLVEKAFWGIVDEAELPEEFPLECVDQLRRFGKTLQAEEAAEFLQKDERGVWKERRAGHPVCVFDDSPAAYLMRPRLTVVAQPTYRDRTGCR